MKKVVLLTASVLMIGSAAFADHVGVYTDETGSSSDLHCGFNQTATIIHKFTLGTTGLRFKVEFPPGTAFFSFTTPYVPIGLLLTDLTVGYGQCFSGSIPVGNIVAILPPGTANVQPANGFPVIITTDCNFDDYAATGGWATIFGNCPVATEPTTWGRVKSLYR
jgi:hypothetical protein